MGIIGILAQGFGTAGRRFKLAVYLWLANFALAALPVAPLYFTFQKSFGRSLMGGRLFSGATVLWLEDLVHEYRNLGPVFLGWGLAVALAYIAVRIFLVGGVIGRLASGQGRVTLRDFFENGAEYFWRLARVFLVTVLGYLVVIGIIGRLAGIPFDLWMKDAPTQWTILTASMVRLLVLLLLFSVVKLFFDYVKVVLVAEDRRGAVRGTLRNFGFIGRRFFQLWAIFLIVGGLFAAVTAAYLAVGRVIPRSEAGGWSALLFIWQQAYVFAAGWVGVLFFATEYHVWRSRQVLRG